jgi:hypothetical protein
MVWVNRKRFGAESFWMLGSGEWEVVSRKWEVGSGEWEVGSGKLAGNDERAGEWEGGGENDECGMRNELAGNAE